MPVIEKIGLKKIWLKKSITYKPASRRDIFFRLNNRAFATRLYFLGSTLAHIVSVDSDNWHHVDFTALKTAKLYDLVIFNNRISIFILFRLKIRI